MAFHPSSPTIKRLQEELRLYASDPLRLPLLYIPPNNSQTEVYKLREKFYIARRFARQGGDNSMDFLDFRIAHVTEGGGFAIEISARSIATARVIPSAPPKATSTPAQYELSEEEIITAEEQSLELAAGVQGLKGDAFDTFVNNGLLEFCTKHGYAVPPLKVR